MSTSNSDYELLTEHFGYPPVALIDDIINTVNVLADRALDSVERLLLSIPPASLGFNSKTSKDATGTPIPPEEAAKLEIENGTHQLETLLNASVDKNFDFFELYIMNNILTVKQDDQPFMKLAHYDGLDFEAVEKNAGGGSGSGADAPSIESVTALRRKLHASQKLHVALEAERMRNDVLLQKLKNVLGAPPPSGVKREDNDDQMSGAANGDGSAAGSAFGFLRNKGDLETGGTDNPITTTTEFTLSQLQALRALSTSLRSILPDLGSAAEQDDEEEEEEEEAATNGKKTWRRERVEYVEGTTRKYLEKSRGLELGAQGEVRDGEWQGQGRKLTREEVEGLEQVVSMLNGGKEKGGDVDVDDDADDAMDES